MFKIILKKKAQKFLEKTDKPTKERLANAILDLKYAPLTGDVKKLSGKFLGISRLRIGDSRVLFTRNESTQKIIIYDINNRGDIY